MDHPPAKSPSFREALRFWIKLGFVSFGGPTGQIAIIHQEVVDRNKWLSEDKFLHALNYCMLLPGPEATQLAIYIGWLFHGTLGGLVAGILFILPSVFVLWGLSLLYVSYGSLPWIAALFTGVKPVIVAIIGFAAIRIGRKVLKNQWSWILAGLSFLLISAKIPYPIILICAATLGYGSRRWGLNFVQNSHSAQAPIPPPSLQGCFPSWFQTSKKLLAFLMIWWLPLGLLAWFLGGNGVWFQEGLFFSKAALVTFGGAYAILPYVADHAVNTHGWLSPSQMMDGLALAETTPGPLIMVLQFVGFMGGWNQPGTLSPLLSASLGALVTTWVTFVPSFLFILVGAPYIEWIPPHKDIKNALSSITSAVVGVILTLGVWFGIHLFLPSTGGINLPSLTIFAVAAVGLWRWNWNLIHAVCIGGLSGLVFHAIKSWC